jgi:cellulose synthase/poly-beta-1,6-N-acetylglucosamine synthase-like glycosyltransferase
MNPLHELRERIRTFLMFQLSRITADTLGWLAAILIHCATIPTLLALLQGLSDHTPSLDVVLFMWTGLLLLFARAVVLKDVLNILTIGLGFIMQATIMACILFE